MEEIPTDSGVVGSDLSDSVQSVVDSPISITPAQIYMPSKTPTQDQDTIYVMVNNPVPWIDPAVIGLIGSLVVLLVGGAVRELYTRSKTNYEALVRSERLLNKILSLLSDLSHEIEGIITRVALAKEKNKPLVPVKLAIPFIPDDEILLPLKDSQFVNGVFLLFQDLLKLNRSVEQVNELQTQIEDLIQASGEREDEDRRRQQYTNFEWSLNHNMLAFIAELDKEIQRLASESRMLINESRPWWVEIANRIIVRKIQNREEKIAAEQQKFTKEIEDIQRKDDARIERMRRQGNMPSDPDE